MTGTWAGVFGSFLAGIVNGSFATPTKYAPRWEWENIWAVWAVTALFAVPWIVGFATVPRIISFYRDTDAEALILLMALGLGVGVAQIFFALALAEVGLSIGFAVTIGLSTAIGSLLPLLLVDPRVLTTAKGVMILAGVGLMLAGTATCGIASNRKEREKEELFAGVKRTGFRRGLAFCVFAGLLSPLLNVALAYGAPLIRRAAEIGVGPSSQANVIWPPVFTATLIPYLAYCIHRWRRNQSWRLYAAPRTFHYWLLGSLMGILWTGSVILYGYSSILLGHLGPVVGWPLFMSVIIITSNVWGFITREWRGTTHRTVGLMLGGIGLLVFGFCTIAATSS